VALSAEDRLLILDTFARYNRALDKGDGDAFAAVFTPDGEFRGPGGPCKGREQLRAMAAAYYDHPDVNSVQHWTGSIVLDGDGESATSQASVICISPTPDGQSIRVELMGEYADVLSKVDDRWLFKVREVVSVLPAEIEEFSLPTAQVS